MKIVDVEVGKTYLRYKFGVTSLVKVVSKEWGKVACRVNFVKLDSDSKKEIGNFISYSDGVGDIPDYYETTI